MAQSRDGGVIQVRVDVDATHADDPIASPGEVKAFAGTVEAVASGLPLAHGALHKPMALCLGPMSNGGDNEKML